MVISNTRGRNKLIRADYSFFRGLISGSVSKFETINLLINYIIIYSIYFILLYIAVGFLPIKPKKLYILGFYLLHQNKPSLLYTFSILRQKAISGILTFLTSKSPFRNLSPGFS